MALPETLWDKIRRGEFGQTDAAIAEVLCSVGRQLAFRLDKLIDYIKILLYLTCTHR